jgi:hypothetical protein
VTRDREGRTATEAADDLFAFELCDECGGDAADHDGVLVLGNWFMECAPICPVLGHADHREGASY